MLATHLGFFNTATTRTHVRFQFSTHAAAGGNVAPNSAFEAADLRIYRASGTGATSSTQRSSANGITMTSPFDSLVGVHDVAIDLTDNTDSGFYAAGYQYSVMLCPDETVDSQTLTGVVLAYFEIGVPGVDMLQVSGDATAADNLETAFDDTAGAVPWLGIVDQGTAQSASSTGLVLRSAAAFADNVLIGAVASVYGSTQGYWQSRFISDNALSGDAVTVDPAWDVTPSGTITYKLWGSPPVDDSGSGLSASDIRDAVGLASANLDTQLAAIPTNAGLSSALATADDAVLAALAALDDLSQAQIREAIGLASANTDTQLAALLADTNDIQTRLPAALVSGRMDSRLGAVLGIELQEEGSDHQQVGGPQ